MKIKKKIEIGDLPKQLRSIRDRIKKDQDRISKATVGIFKKATKIAPSIVDEFAEAYISAKENEKSAKEIADSANESIKRMADLAGVLTAEDTGDRQTVEGDNYIAGYSLVQGSPQIDSNKAAKVLSEKELLSVSDLVIDKVKLENAIRLGKIDMKKAKNFLISPPPTKRIYVHRKK